MIIVLEPAHVNVGEGAGGPLLCYLSQNPSFRTAGRRAQQILLSCSSQSFW